jgi:hypothetical protein
MKQEIKKSTPKNRIVVLEKGKPTVIDAYSICCWTSLFAVR